MGILKQQVCDIDATVNHFVSGAPPLQMPHQGSDELQLATNEAGLEPFEVNHITSFGEGIGWRAKKLGQGQGTNLVPGGGRSTYQLKGS